MVDFGTATSASCQDALGSSRHPRVRVVAERCGPFEHLVGGIQGQEEECALLFSGGERSFPELPPTWGEEIQEGAPDGGFGAGEKPPEPWEVLHPVR